MFENGPVSDSKVASDRHYAVRTKPSVEKSTCPRVGISRIEGISDYIAGIIWKRNAQLSRPIAGSPTNHRQSSIVDARGNSCHGGLIWQLGLSRSVKGTIR